MAKFYFIAKVRRVVEDTVSLAVETNKNVTAARHMAEHVAARVPEPAEDGSEVVYCYIENRDVLESDVQEITLVRPDDNAAA